MSERFSDEQIKQIEALLDEYLLSSTHGNIAEALAKIALSSSSIATDLGRIANVLEAERARALAGARTGPMRFG